jgi:hypothetical protein
MGTWQIFRPHRWARRSDAEKSVRFNEVVAAIQSALRNHGRSRRLGRRLATTPVAVNLPNESAKGGAHASDT